MTEATMSGPAWHRLAEAEPALARDLVRRVEQGARLLDRVEPGWHLRIACDRLAMESCDRCILGQLHGTYQEGFRVVLETLSRLVLYSSAEHGFTLYNDEQDAPPDWSLGGPIHPEALLRFAALADLWRKQVRARLG